MRVDKQFGGKAMRQGKLNIGLSYYQEEEWQSAIRKYGVSILGRSLLSKEQKTILIKYAEQVECTLPK